MKKCLRLLFWDQLSHSISTLENIDKHNDIIVLLELKEEATYVKHHKMKLAYLFSCMRHFAQELKNKGFEVYYLDLDDPQNSGIWDQELMRAYKRFSPQKLVLCEPSEYRLLEKVHSWQKCLPCPIEIYQDRRFCCSIDKFKAWASGKKQLRLEFFYREMRKEHNILLDSSGRAVGGAWNYDSENRSPPTKNMTIPKRIPYVPDNLTKQTIALVTDTFTDHFGDLEAFCFPVTKNEALTQLDFFLTELLPSFGLYQDVMLENEAFLYHSVLSMALNVGLLEPLEVCKKAENCYLEGKAPLNAVEGFIRQILGWREFVRGIYWLKMPGYQTNNFFQAKRALPTFYWSANTQMNCIKQAVTQTKQHAYSHHIQRLMVTGNFALLAGLNPVEVCQWYLIVYADAFEWVELPNTLGMALFGDGGFLASKPYAASGKYIQKMSNFCKNCYYDPQDTLGEKACPFNSLYWHFLSHNKPKLATNQRLSYTYATWNKMASDKQKAILAKATSILANLDSGQLL